MIESYFAEFHGTEQELKEEIHSILESLNALEPEQWPQDLLTYSNPNMSSQEILSNLLKSLPGIDKVNLSGLELIESLRAIAVGLKIVLNRKRLNYLFIKQLYMECSNLFLTMKYIIASEVLTEKLNKELLYDPDKIVSILQNEVNKPDQFSLVFATAKAAREEINRVLADDSAKQYAEYILDFEKAVEEYIENNYYGVVVESFTRIASEAILSNLDMTHINFQLGEPIRQADKRELSEKILRIARQDANRRLGIKKGGARKKKGFSWTPERIVTFYNQVESLPKIKGQSCWEFALSELIEQAFDSETIAWLMSRQAFRDVPDSLFRDAIRVWRKNLDRESWNEMKREEKPRSFEFRHALYLLNYPDEYKFSTLETHYLKGKKKASDFQSKTRKS